MGRKTERLIALVTEAFKNADENGYGPQLRAMSLDEQVNDLRDFDAEIAPFRHQDVFEAVRQVREGETV